MVASACRAGYEVYAVDHFCDRDLRQYAVAYRKFDELAELPPLIAEICDTFGIDAILPTSGAENLQNLPVPVLGTDPGVAAKFLDKAYIQSFFEEIGIPVPPVVSPGTYPAMLKPTMGSGGWRNTVVNSASDVAAWKEAFPGEPFLLQEIADGIPASVCCVSDGCHARAIAVNRQILRGKGPYKYGFSGSVTPFDHPLMDEMIRYAEQAAAASGCRGVLGIDFIAGESQVYAIELNPRFVGTLDTIEAATGLNLVSLHISACRGMVPDATPRPLGYAIRKILFADRIVRVCEDLSPMIPHVADIPVTPARFEEGEAIISVLAAGSDLVSAERELDTTIKSVAQYIQ